MYKLPFIPLYQLHEPSAFCKSFSFSADSIKRSCKPFTFSESAMRGSTSAKCAKRLLA